MPFCSNTCRRILTKQKGYFYKTAVNIFASMLLLIISLYLLAYGVFAEEATQTITLTCTSNSEDVLFEEVDNYECKVQLLGNKEGASQSILRGYIKINNTIDFDDKNSLTICNIDVKNKTAAERCYCNNSDCSEIIWNMFALQNDNRKLIKAGWLYNEATEIFSKELRVPHSIKAPRIEDVHFSVNNQDVRKNDRIRISNADSKLYLTLSSDDKEALKLCTLDYDTDDHHMKSGNTIILKPENITIKVKMCGRELGRYNLKILYDDPNKLVRDLCIATLTIVSVGVLTQFIYYVVLAISHILAKRRETKRNRKEKTEKDNKSLKSEHQKLNSKNNTI
ncbi:uncharacterized protein LOC106076246 isoform X3 [Biomphalaria glabrata]|uniref:Uncharacterized protein LOC106076246 isoform X3 n=1 Tax=Biomphalaria glabrata TaxID=6526 RepID=A0A9W2YT41_BIOGL|nr:uncharacterized protein LOC106076246 isoform X3 [Biomphalaria glabrata]